MDQFVNNYQLFHTEQIFHVLALRKLPNSQTSFCTTKCYYNKNVFFKYTIERCWESAVQDFAKQNKTTSLFDRRAKQAAGVIVTVCVSWNYMPICINFDTYLPFGVLP